jgi:hypothetical protein
VLDVITLWVGLGRYAVIVWVFAFSFGNKHGCWDATTSYSRGRLCLRRGRPIVNKCGGYHQIVGLRHAKFIHCAMWATLSHTCPSGDGGESLSAVLAFEPIIRT